MFGKGKTSSLFDGPSHWGQLNDCNLARWIKLVTDENQTPPSVPQSIFPLFTSFSMEKKVSPAHKKFTIFFWRCISWARERFSCSHEKLLLYFYLLILLYELCSFLFLSASVTLQTLGHCHTFIKMDTFLKSGTKQCREVIDEMSQGNQ